MIRWEGRAYNEVLGGVRPLDLLTSGQADKVAARRQNIAHLVGNSLFEFMRHDIT